LSRGRERQTLIVNSLAAIIVGVDSLDPTILLENHTALIGDSYDIEELLANIGGDNEIASTDKVSLAMTEGNVIASEAWQSRF
jgi:hypothetical protein